MSKNFLIFISFIVLASSLCITAQSKRPALIRDTDLAEGKDESEIVLPKEYNPAEAVKNLKVGDFYFRKKNWEGAIERYFEALQYQPDLRQAREKLRRACTMSLEQNKDYLRKNPDAPDLAERQQKIARLEKALADLNK
jgi:tetratricopeptide (TPR) repeat protein